MKNPNRVLSRETILSSVWEMDWDVETNVVDVYISYLRNKVDKPAAKKTDKNRHRNGLHPDGRRYSMKIRQRLTLIFTLTIAGVLFTLSTIIYFVSKDFHEKEFNQQLDLRLDRTEKFFLETTGLPSDLAQQIRELYLQKLPQETEWALDPDQPLPEELAPYLNAEINELQRGKKIMV
jgi:hypothetical protein